ncbi:hypothetical protein [Pseudomonas pergaminensis]|uniref:hypothetical protein n=1 Tax=Pseudomonas pergaminensis TaxID=2853159 RepID=UPI0034D74C34
MSIKCGVLLVISFNMVGCAVISDDYPTIYQSSRTSSGDVDKTLTQNEAQSVLDNLAPYARMAEAVYRRDLGDSWKSLATACDYVTSTDESIRPQDLPKGWRRLDKSLMVKLGMEAQNPIGAPLRPCRGAAGLEYETYMRFGPGDKPLEAVISFRGTENKKHQWLSDWSANFSNVDFGVGGNAQFKEARAEGTRLVEALSRVLPKGPSSDVCKATSGHEDGVQAPIDLVGHSLGGGLAQHVAYSNKACDVRSTIAFDPSPATGWFFLKWRRALTTKDPIIYRVYLDGEILSFARVVSTKFNTPRDNRRDIRMVFPGVTEGAFGRHAMTILSTGINSAASVRPVDTITPGIDYGSHELHPEITSIEVVNPNQ